MNRLVAIGADPDVESLSATLIETEEGFQPVFFKPRRLKNLVRIDQVESLMPILDMKVANLFEEETTHIFTLCGRGPRSSLGILRPGVAISEMATIEEISDNGFLDTTPSLAVSSISDDSLMQVHPSGIRHIREDRRINEWRTLDMTGQLMEVEKNEMLSDVACLDIAPVPKGWQMSRFLAVGSYDNTIRILSLDPDNRMHVLSVQSVTVAPKLLLFLEVQASVGWEDGTDHPASLFLNAGLQNRVLFRTIVGRVHVLSMETLFK
ncbi:spliceosome-associated protein 130 A [Tanacetum coccineum]